VFVELNMVDGGIGVGSGDAAPADGTAERVELETVATTIESTTGVAQSEGSLYVV